MRSAARLFTLYATGLSTLLTLVGLAQAYDVRLTWSSVPGAVYYKLYSRDGSESYGAGTDLNGLVQNTDGTVEFVVAGLQSGISHTFALTGCDASGIESGLSNELSVSDSDGAAATATPTPSSAVLSPSATPTAFSLAPTVTFTPISAVVPDGLVAAYSFDESNGSAVYDASGYGNDGVIEGAVTRSTSGKFGNGALSFPGTTGSYVTVPSSASLATSSGVTVEAWIFPTVLDSTLRQVVIKEMSQPRYDAAWALYGSGWDNTNKPAAEMTDAATNNWFACRADTDLALNAWNHVAVTYDKVSGLQTVYLNGVADHQCNQGSYDLKVSDQPLRIGGSPLWSYYFAGRIDEVRIWNYARSASQVATDRDTGIGAVSPPATLTPTATITKSSSPSPTRTLSPSPTSTNSATSTVTSSATRTASSTVTSTNSPTRTLTATASPTSTWTPTSTVTVTPTYSATQTSTPSSTRTFTATSSLTPTLTATSTSTRTPSPTPTQTSTPTGTSTNTATKTATSTRTPSASPTSTPSYSPTPTFTAMPSFTRTYTASSTVTASMTETPTSTSSSTPSFSSTPTARSPFTASSTRTQTPTPSATETATASRTPTMSYSPTATPTSSPSATWTATRTSTATATWTSTTTVTATQTSTASFSATPTETSTTTATAAPSWTPTPSSTQTARPTRTATPSPSWSPTRTTTSTPTSTSSRTPTRSPRPTATVTATNTTSRTPTWTPTATLTVASTSSPTQTASASPTFTYTATATATPTLTPTTTATTTPSRSSTPTPSSIPLDTETASPTSTAAETPTPSYSTTPSGTPTPTPSQTVVDTQTATPTLTATETPTPSYSTTPSRTPTPTPSQTAVDTQTASPTLTTTDTVIPVDSTTPTVSPAASESAAVETATYSDTPTASATSTESATSTATESPTPSATETNTQSFTATPTETATAVDTATAASTETPSATETTSPTPSATPTTSATPTATATKVPMGRPLGIALRSLSQPLLNLYYLTVGRRSAESGAASSIAIASVSAPDVAPLAAIGDLDGDGQDDLILAGASTGSVGRDELEVYHVGPGSQPTLMSTVHAFPQTSSVTITHLLVADVDPSLPGSEVIVADDGGGRASARVRILNGSSLDGMHPLGQFRSLRSRRSRDGAFTLAVGDVLGLHQGKQVVVGDAGGRVSVYSVRDGSAVSDNRFDPFPDAPGATAGRLAVGDVLVGHAGDEIVVGDDGSRRDSSVRVFDGRDGSVILEFSAFSSGGSAGVQLWIGDVISDLPGDELIVGQDADGGTLRVFSLASGTPIQLFDIPDPLPRLTGYKQDLAIGDLLPGLPGDEIAIAQPDPQMPVQVFHLDASGAVLTNALQPDDSNDASTVGAVMIGQ